MADSSLDSRNRRRRWWGGACLLAAIIMVGLDGIGLRGRLAPAVYLGYWLVCFLFTMAATWTALVELRALRRKSREAQKGLFEDTLRDIDRDRKAHQPDDQS